MSIKRLEIDGRLGADAKIENSKNGKRYLSFSIAHDDFENGKNVTTWYQVVVTNASTIDYYENKNLLKKGYQVIVRGTFREEDWTNKKGENVHSITIYPDIIDNIFSGRSNAEGQNQNQAQYQKPVHVQEKQAESNPIPPSDNTFANVPEPVISDYGMDAGGEDDLPF